MTEKIRKKRPVILLIAIIIGILMLAYTWNYIGTTANSLSVKSDDSASSIGASLAMAMVMPHQVLSTLACFFAMLGWAFKARWAAIVAAILYTVALVLMLPWFYFVILQMILCYIAVAQMKS